jgi:thioredoxin 1
MTANGIMELTEATFDQEISNGLTLVDFWAPWCGPCRMQTPILERVASKVAGKAKIAKLNVDEHGEPAARFGVRAIPTLILFKDGKAVQQFVGVQPEDSLVSVIEAAGG